MCQAALNNDEQMSNDEKDLPKGKAVEILANVMGFTGHMRLDVKKPGSLMPTSQADISKVLQHNKSETNADNKEILPTSSRAVN